MEMEKNYYSQLTSFRAIAAYMVYLHHGGANVSSPLLAKIFSEMYIGVPMFFVLSGFLIYLRYSDKLALNTKWLYTYFINRFAKIFPVYFFVVCINFFLVGNLFYFFMQITFLRGFFDEYKFIGVAQGWSLTVEETFYFLFPLLLLLIKRVGFLISLIITYFIGFIILKIGTLAHFHGFFTPAWFVFGFTFFGYAGDFFIGMYLAKLIINKQYISLQKKLPNGAITLFAICALALYLLIMAKVTFYYNCRFGTFTLLGRVTLHTILPLIITVLLYGLITEESWICRILQTRLAVLLGKSSYIFYLIHMGPLRTMIQHISHNKIIIFILLNLLAILLYYSLEIPCMKLIKNIGLFKIRKHELSSQSI